MPELLLSTTVLASLTGGNLALLARAGCQSCSRRTPPLPSWARTRPLSMTLVFAAA